MSKPNSIKAVPSRPIPFVRRSCRIQSARAAFAFAASFLSLGSALAADDTSQSGGEVQLNSVTVTASPLTDDANSLATVVDSVGRNGILKQGGANLADALKDVPGVSGSNFAAGASRPVIRGFDATRVRILEDGIGSFDVSDIGPDHGVPIDPLATTRIEVVRGAGTLRYGSQAIGGVVNAINNRVPQDLPDRPFGAEITGTYGTNGDTTQNSAVLDGRVGQFALHADGFNRQVGDYDTPHGTQPNSFFQGDGYSAGGSYFFGRDDSSHIGLAAIHYDAKYGIPSDTSYIDMRQTKELMRSSFAIDSGALQTLNVDGGYANYQHTENESDGEVATTFKNKEWDSRAEALFGALGPLSRSALGVQVQGRDYSALGEDSSYLFPTTTHNYAGFGFTEAPLNRSLSLQAGARLERVTTDGTPASDVKTSRDFTPVSGSLGLVYDMSKSLNLGLTLSSTARAPAVTELFARGAHDGPGTFETGDPTLSTERSNSLEGTLRFHNERVHLEVSAWGAKFNNFIYGALTGLYCDEDGNCQPVSDDDHDLKQLDYTQTGATFYGAEGRSTLALYRGDAGKFDAELLADYVHATLEGGGPVPRIPPYHVGAGLDWEKGSVAAGFLFKYTGARNNVAAFETPTSGFTNLDAQISWHPLEGTPGLELMLVGHNLTNTTQRDAVAFNKDEVILPGRDVRLTARAVF